MAIKNQLKEGLVYISEKTGQLRYADTIAKPTSPTDKGSDYDNERWLHPLSKYYALEDIDRGQPVSIALADQLHGVTIDSQFSYVVPTQPHIHQKCIGLAMHPVKAKELVQILGHGTFDFFNQTQLDNYVPDFVKSITTYTPTYRDLVGKVVYVSAKTSSDKGKLTIDPVSDVYTTGANVVQIGHITDFNNNDELGTELDKIYLTLEVDLEGDGRGPVGVTQFDGVLKTGKYVINKDRIPIRVFSSKVRDGDSIAQYYAHVSCNVTSTLETEIDELNSVSAQFIGLKSDDKLVVCYFNDNTHITNAVDDAWIHSFSSVVNAISVHLESLFNFTIYDTKEKVFSHLIDNILTSLLKYFQPSSSDYEFEPLNVDYNQISLQSGTEIGYNYTFDLKTKGETIPLQLYASCDLCNTMFTNLVYFANEGQYYPAVHAVTGDALLSPADIRLGPYQNIYGIYYGGIYDVELDGPPNRHLFLRQGEFEIPSDSPSLKPGIPYYLDIDGYLTENPNLCYEYRCRIGFAKTDRIFVLTIGDMEQINYATHSIGYIKKRLKHSVTSSTPPITNIEYLTEPGYHPLDGITTLNSNNYAKVLDALYAIGYTDEDLNYNVPSAINPPNEFTLPLIEFNGEKTEIRTTETGLSHIHEYSPVLRFSGKFQQIDKTTQLNKTFDISPVVKFGPLFGSIAESIAPNENIALWRENIDIHLFIYYQNEWIELPEGLFTFNNTQIYGYKWIIKKIGLDTYVVSADIANGYGFAYFNQSAAPELLTNTNSYRITVAKKTYWHHSIDLSELFHGYVSNIVIKDNELPITSKALINYFEREFSVDRLYVLTDVYLGKNASGNSPGLNNFELTMVNSQPAIINGHIQITGLSDSDIYGTFNQIEISGIRKNIFPYSVLTDENGRLLYQSADCIDSGIDLGVIDFPWFTKPSKTSPNYRNIPSNELIPIKREELDSCLIPYSIVADHIKLLTNDRNNIENDIAPHGIIQGTNGNFSAGFLGGIQLGWDSTTVARNYKNIGLPFNDEETSEFNNFLDNVDFDRKTAYVPFVHKGEFNLNNVIRIREPKNYIKYHSKSIDDAEEFKLGNSTLVSSPFISDDIQNRLQGRKPREFELLTMKYSQQSDTTRGKYSSLETISLMAEYESKINIEDKVQFAYDNNVPFHYTINLGLLSFIEYTITEVNSEQINSSLTDIKYDSLTDSNPYVEYPLTFDNFYQKYNELTLSEQTAFSDDVMSPSSISIPYGAYKDQWQNHLSWSGAWKNWYNNVVSHITNKETKSLYLHTIKVNVTGSSSLSNSDDIELIEALKDKWKAKTPTLQITASGSTVTVTYKFNFKYLSSNNVPDYNIGNVSLNDKYIPLEFRSLQLNTILFSHYGDDLTITGNF